MRDFKLFMNQIEEDIELLVFRFETEDSNMSNRYYAFNYWILSRMYSIDEELISDSVTEYNDKAVDCFVHFLESKKLFIIQNKYYNMTNSVTRKDVADFLQTPISVLKNGNYTKSVELQNIFNNTRDDKEYTIYFHFYATTDKKDKTIDDIIKEFNSNDHKIKCLVDATYFGLSEIYDLYFGENYREEKNFTHKLGTTNKGTIASLKEQYKMKVPYEARYIVTSVVEIYRMIKAAEQKRYPLFEKNIREYLGENPINNSIIKTLRSEKERSNFIYYNNGITVICKQTQDLPYDPSSESLKISLVNPQIINGCQTVSSIKKVLGSLSYNENELEENYGKVYVMLRVLVIANLTEEAHKIFYSNVVKYTNRQNAISEKAFISNMTFFYRLQKEFEERGFILLVRPSDKYSYGNRSKSEKERFIGIANENKNVRIILGDKEINKYNDLYIPLEKLLQVFLAFMKTGYFAFAKKNHILKPETLIFKDLSAQINNYLTINNMINLYALYKRAELEQLSSEDKRTPIPYYVIGFLGSLIIKKEDNKEDKLDPDKVFDIISRAFDIIFSSNMVFNETYKYLVAISKSYRRNYEKDSRGDYGVMIKRPIDESILKHTLATIRDIGDWKHIDSWTVNLYKHSR